MRFCDATQDLRVEMLARTLAHLSRHGQKTNADHHGRKRPNSLMKTGPNVGSIQMEKQETFLQKHGIPLDDKC
jgi:hypothetical protein